MVGFFWCLALALVKFDKARRMHGTARAGNWGEGNCGSNISAYLHDLKSLQFRICKDG
jgi:hypothetical protein